MGGGNGAKAQQARDRKAKEVGKGGVSQLKTNQAAQSIQCDICKQPFQGTSKKPVLLSHIESKHSKETFEKCFPKYTE